MVIAAEPSSRATPGISSGGRSGPARDVDAVGPPMLQPGTLAMAFGGGVRQLAAGLGVELDTVGESCERLAAPDTLEIASGTIPEGTAAAVRFEIRGLLVRRFRPAAYAGLFAVTWPGARPWDRSGWRILNLIFVPVRCSCRAGHLPIHRF
jgi:hypothetical protein